jgi:hypothetical protein
VVDQTAGLIGGAGSGALEYAERGQQLEYDKMLQQQQGQQDNKDNNKDNKVMDTNKVDTFHNKDTDILNKDLLMDNHNNVAITNNLHKDIVILDHVRPILCPLQMISLNLHNC